MSWSDCLFELQIHNKALLVPGRCLLGVCQLLSASLGEQAAFLLAFHDLVVASLKGQGAKAPDATAGTCNEQLRQHLPKLKALATGSDNSVQQPAAGSET